MSVEGKRLLNIGLRFATLAVRFLFVFFLARYLDAASVGYYGIFTATVGYGLYVVGMDYYVFTTREILNTPRADAGRLLKGQAALAGLLYLVVFPAALFLLHLADWPGHLMWWFFPILFLEHFSQEMSRLFIALSEQITASVILFIRQGSWAIAIVALMVCSRESRNLDAVMALWTCAGVAAAALGIWKLRRLEMGGWRCPVDWGGVKKGVFVSGIFLLATLALRGIQTVDRYWLEALGGIEMVGAYVLFTGVAGAMMVFLDAGVFSFAYPALIGHHLKKEHDLLHAKVQRMFFQTLAFSLAFGAVSWLLLPHLLDWVGNPLYKHAIGLYPWILGATLVNAIGLVPHYALYALGRDKSIVHSHLAALPVFGLFTWALASVYPIVAVPAGLLAAFAFILVWKTLAYWNIRNEYE